MYDLELFKNNKLKFYQNYKRILSDVILNYISKKFL